MPFSGKRYRRVSSENIDLLLTTGLWNNPDKFEPDAQMLLGMEETFTLTRIDQDTFTLTQQSQGSTNHRILKLDDEYELETPDGTKVKATVSQPSKNVLVQTLTDPNGKTAVFKKEFLGKHCYMTILPADTDVYAKIIFEADKPKHDHHNMLFRFWHTNWLRNIITNDGKHVEEKHCGCNHCTVCGPTRNQNSGEKCKCPGTSDGTCSGTDDGCCKHPVVETKSP